jgi:hypothetical protein
VEPYDDVDWEAQHAARERYAPQGFVGWEHTDGWLLLAKAGFLPYGRFVVDCDVQVVRTSAATADAISDASLDLSGDVWTIAYLFDPLGDGEHDLFAIEGPWLRLVPREPPPEPTPGPAAVTPAERLLWEGPGRDAVAQFVTAVFDTPAGEDRALLLLGGPLIANAMVEDGDVALQLLHRSDDPVPAELVDHPDWLLDPPNAIYEWEGATDRSAVAAVLAAVVVVRDAMQVWLDWSRPTTPPLSLHRPERTCEQLSEVVAMVGELLPDPDPYVTVAGGQGEVEVYRDTREGTFGVEWLSGVEPTLEAIGGLLVGEPLWPEGDGRWVTGGLPRSEAEALVGALARLAGGPYTILGTPDGEPAGP